MLVAVICLLFLLFGLIRVFSSLLLDCNENILICLLVLLYNLQQEDEELLVPHTDIVEGPQAMDGMDFCWIWFSF